MFIEPHKLENQVSEYSGYHTAWYKKTYNYDTWIRQAFVLQNNPVTYSRGRYIECLAYYVTGKLDHAMAIAQQEIGGNRNYLIIYTTCLFMTGQIEACLSAFDRHYHPSNDIIENAKRYTSMATYALLIFDSEKANEYLKKIPATDIPYIMDKIQEVQGNIDITALRLEQINRANLPLDLVKDVLQLSVKTMCKQGNYAFSVQFESLIPNDVLYITFHCEELSLDEMDELNNLWLDTIIDSELPYDFHQLSRVSVNFRPSLNAEGV